MYVCHTIVSLIGWNFSLLEIAHFTVIQTLAQPGKKIILADRQTDVLKDRQIAMQIQIGRNQTQIDKADTEEIGIDLCRYGQMKADTDRYIQIDINRYRYRQIQIDIDKYTYRYRQLDTDRYRRIQIQADTDRYRQIQIDIDKYTYRYRQIQIQIQAARYRQIQTDTDTDIGSQIQIDIDRYRYNQLDIDRYKYRYRQIQI